MGLRHKFSGIALAFVILQLKMEFTAIVGTTRPVLDQKTVDSLDSQKNEILGDFPCEEKERPSKEQPMKLSVD